MTEFAPITLALMHLLKGFFLVAWFAVAYGIWAGVAGLGKKSLKHWLLHIISQVSSEVVVEVGKLQFLQKNCFK